MPTIGRGLYFCGIINTKRKAKNMELFPYPIQLFSCRQYDDVQMKKMDNNDVIFYDRLQFLAGAVSGETGIDGLKLDFRCGLRLQVPAGNWHVKITDRLSHKTYFADDLEQIVLVSQEKYFITWHIEITKDKQLIFIHDFDPMEQHVHFFVLSQAMGDTLAFLPAMQAFADRYHSQVSMTITPALQEYAAVAYPNLCNSQVVAPDVYAVFCMATSYEDLHCCPMDGRELPLLENAKMILGLHQEIKPNPWPNHGRIIREPYVCIGVQGSSTLKAWQYPGGWEVVTDYLKSLGYRVFCIDRERVQENYSFRMEMPANAEDLTGNHPLVERAELLAHADFFIGLGSGLSWLAWAVSCPVVMVAGFSAVWYEFPNPYRVMNPMACHACFNDLSVPYLKNPCYRYGKGHKRYLECQRTITPEMVIEVIDELRRNVLCRCVYDKYCNSEL